MNRLVIVLCALVTITNAIPFNWKIVGGQDARPGQFPYQASIRAVGKHYCGGSIISKRWILTAAVCVEGLSINFLSVAVGTNQINDPNARVYQVEGTRYHENYDPWNSINDVAVVRVSEDIELDDNVQVIPLNTEDIGSGVTLTLSGWGLTSYPGNYAEALQWIELTSLTRDECLSHNLGPILDTEICTLTRSGEGACLGDNGSPLVLNGRQVGIYTWGKPCAVGYPDVYTRVSSFTGWIQEQIA